jgi:hypothetical protein
LIALGVGLLFSPTALAETLVDDRGASAEPSEAAVQESGHYRLSPFSESAFGVDQAFYNHLFGLRLDRRFSEDMSFGAALSYANLEGPRGRAHNVLTMVGVEYRPTLGRSTFWRVPLRFSSGFLPNNGPVLQVSAGLAMRLGSDTELTVNLLAPTLWVAGDHTEYSFNLGVELALF